MTSDAQKTEIYELEFRANPTQQLFIQSQARADLFSSRMGEGKSAGLCWANFYHVKHNPGAPWAFIRDTWENLQKTTLQEFFTWFPVGICGDWMASTKTYTWRIEGMGNAQVMFFGMDDPADASKLQSMALGGFAIDEPAPAAESGGVSEMIFDIAMTRLRFKGMKWYAAKLATNNPDESHWTYRRFWDPGTVGFRAWQPPRPENMQNLPPNYYEGLRDVLAHRPDLVARFIEGKVGYQQAGQAVTPEWNDEMHLATGLVPIKGKELLLLWDFGLNPTCLITQVTPTGHWNFIESFVGEEIGVLELIQDQVKPVLTQRYRNFTWRHIGDPQGSMREQSSSMQTAVRTIRKELGGTWRPGVVRTRERVPCLRSALSKLINGRGLVQVDRHKAKHVWQALRGGWHRHVGRTSVVGEEPVKDMHSHPGDAASYGASRLFPQGKLLERRGSSRPIQTAKFMGRDRTSTGSLGFEQPGLKLPKEARRMGGSQKGI